MNRVVSREGPQETLARVGEEALLARIAKRLVAASGVRDVVTGPGDDAAVIRFAGDGMVMTVDSQREGVHFERHWLSPIQLGRRALVVAASDVAAMGAEPRWALCSAALSNEIHLGYFDDLLEGLREGGEEIECSVVGGDLAAGPGIELVISVIGRVPSGQPTLLRSGAIVDSGCWITGHPGRASFGRQLLAAGDSSGNADHSALRDAFVRPVPPFRFAAGLARDRLATAAIDVSDGLARDLSRLCRCSGIGVRLEEAVLCDDPVMRSHSAGDEELLAHVLDGGEDYGLLCAVPKERESAFVMLGEKLGARPRRIGTFVPADLGLTLHHAGRARPLHECGWDHFDPARRQ